ADFDHAGSGNADILWQNDHGALALWQMEAATVAAVHALPNPGPTWHVVGDNDFNADIADDISLPERQWSGGDLDRHQRVRRQTWVVRRRGIPARHREWLGGAGPLGGEGSPARLGPAGQRPAGRRRRNGYAVLRRRCVPTGRERGGIDHGGLNHVEGASRGVCGFTRWLRRGTRSGPGKSARRRLSRSHGLVLPDALLPHHARRPG